MASETAEATYPNSGSDEEREAFDRGQRHALEVVLEAFNLRQDARGIAEVMLERISE